MLPHITEKQRVLGELSTNAFGMFEMKQQIDLKCHDFPGVI